MSSFDIIPLLSGLTKPALDPAAKVFSHSVTQTSSIFD
jgi:hypothetical protein